LILCSVKKTNYIVFFPQKNGRGQLSGILTTNMQVDHAEEH